MRTPFETAVLLAVLLVRNNQTRARVSSQTVKILGERKSLRAAFVVEVIRELQEFGWVMFEISSGGYGAVRSSALEAAKSATVKRLFSDEERLSLRRGQVSWDALLAEALGESEEGSADDDE